MPPTKKVNQLVVWVRAAYQPSEVTVEVTMQDSLTGYGESALDMVVVASPCPIAPSSKFRLPTFDLPPSPWQVEAVIPSSDELTWVLRYPGWGGRIWVEASSVPVYETSADVWGRLLARAG